MVIDASQYTITQRVVQEGSSSSIFSSVYKFLYPASTPTIENFAIAEMFTMEPFAQNDDFSLDTLLSMQVDAYPDITALSKLPDFFDDFKLDFTMSPDWSEQCSPIQSVFSSPASHYPQLMPSDEDVQLLSPASSFEIDIANYVSYS
jgi:hypothetical protein